MTLLIAAEKAVLTKELSPDFVAKVLLSAASYDSENLRLPVAAQPALAMHALLPTSKYMKTGFSATYPNLPKNRLLRNYTSRTFGSRETVLLVGHLLDSCVDGGLPLLSSCVHGEDSEAVTPGR